MKFKILFSMTAILFAFLVLSGPAFAANYNIDSVAGFMDIANDLTGNYSLDADIDLSSVASFTPIGDSTNPFKGNIIGNGYSISNLTYDGTGTAGVGLFGYAENATFDNFFVRNFDITGQKYVGTLVGSAVNTSFLNIHVFDSTVTAIEEDTDYGKAGGIVGILDETNTNAPFASQMRHCSADNVAVSAHVDGGGLIGCIGLYDNRAVSKTTQVSQCYFNGTVTVSHHSAGGIVGSNFGGHIEKCYAIGSVICTGSSDLADQFGLGLAAGGIIGNMFSGTIDQCFFSGYIDINEGAPDTSGTAKGYLGCVGITHFYSGDSQALSDSIKACPYYVTEDTDITLLDPTHVPLSVVDIQGFIDLNWDIRDVSDPDNNELWVFDDGALRFIWSYVPPVPPVPPQSPGGTPTGSAFIVNPTSDVPDRTVPPVGPSVPSEPSNAAPQPVDSEQPVPEPAASKLWIYLLVAGIILIVGIAYILWQKNGK